MSFELTEKDRVILSIHINEEKNNLTFLDHYIEASSNLIVAITEKLATEKVQLKRHEDYFEVHYFKFVLQTLSLKHLFEKTPFKSIKPDLNLHDLSTIYNCSRSLVESFLTINYLYYNCKSDEQATFRYLLYIVSGLNHRQSYPVPSEDMKKKKAFEKTEIDKTVAEIKTNTYFTTLLEWKQNDLMGKLPAFEMGMKQMISESGLDNDIFHTMWRLFSNYSHSEYIEAMQLREYLKNITRFNDAIYNAYRICFMLNCYQIIKLTERFEQAKQLFNEQSLELRTIIEFYNQLIYGIKMNKPKTTM